jgi:serine/threonine protein kinase
MRVHQLLDFGIAKDISDPGTPLTCAGDVVGTAFYVSPEQLRAPHAVGPSADVWALTVTIYEMLTGAVPFRATTLPEIFHNISIGRFVAATSVNPALPQSIDAFFARALQAEPARRFASVEELTAAFAAVARASEATGLAHYDQRDHSARTRDDYKYYVRPARVPSLSKLFVLNALALICALLYWLSFRDAPPKTAHRSAVAAGGVMMLRPRALEHLSEPVLMTATTGQASPALDLAAPVPAPLPSEPAALPAKPSNARKLSRTETPAKLVNYGF